MDQVQSEKKLKGETTSIELVTKKRKKIRVGQGITRDRGKETSGKRTRLGEDPYGRRCCESACDVWLGRVAKLNGDERGKNPVHKLSPEGFTWQLE